MVVLGLLRDVGLVLLGRLILPRVGRAVLVFRRVAVLRQLVADVLLVAGDGVEGDPAHAVQIVLRPSMGGPLGQGQLRPVRQGLRLLPGHHIALHIPGRDAAAAQQQRRQRGIVDVLLTCNHGTVLDWY